MSESPIKELLEAQIAINKECNESIAVLTYTIQEIRKILTDNQQKEVELVLTNKDKNILAKDNTLITKNIIRQESLLVYIKI